MYFVYAWVAMSEVSEHISFLSSVLPSLSSLTPVFLSSGLPSLSPSIGPTCVHLLDPNVSRCLLSILVHSCRFTLLAVSDTISSNRSTAAVSFMSVTICFSPDTPFTKADEPTQENEHPQQFLVSSVSLLQPLTCWPPPCSNGLSGICRRVPHTSILRYVFLHFVIYHVIPGVVQPSFLGPPSSPLSLYLRI